MSQILSLSKVHLSSALKSTFYTRTSAAPHFTPGPHIMTKSKNLQCVTSISVLLFQRWSQVLFLQRA